MLILLLRITRKPHPVHIELNLPEQKSGEWSLETFYEEGKKYQRLMKGNFLIMDNSPFIVADYESFLQQAEGRIHINGLGIGLCCQYLLSKKTVTELVVVEHDEMVMQMVAPHFSDDPRCTILQGDAFAYEPPTGKIYDFVWHDIWFYRTTKNLEDMERLFRKYKPFTKKQEAWSREKCEKLNRESQKQLVFD